MENNLCNFKKRLPAQTATAALSEFAKKPGKEQKTGKSVAQMVLPRWQGCKG